MTSQPTFTLDEIKRALIADYYGELRVSEDSREEYEQGLEARRRAIEHFNRMRSSLFYCRDNPRAWSDPDDE